MITRNDAVIASPVGRVGRIDGHCRLHAPFHDSLVAITSNPHSTMARESDICLLLPKVQEACPHNLAPTTSTMLQLALGDTLAIALLEKP